MNHCLGLLVTLDSSVLNANLMASDVKMRDKVVNVFLMDL